MTRAVAGRVAVAASLVVAWLAAAWLLTRTSVPSGLVLPHVDSDRVFGAELVSRAERYERFLYVNWVLAQIAVLVTLFVYARRGACFARESAAGPIGTGLLLGMLGLALAWLARLPFSAAALWWERRHGLSHSRYASVLLDGWLELAGTFVAISLALLAVMGLARWLGGWWWLPGSLVLAAVAALLVLVDPYLTPLEPVRDQRLEQAFRRFERAQGVTGIPLRVEEVSDRTSLANAYAVGLGPSRRVVLWDTLLDGRFTHPEVGVVLAHELGHQSRDHIPKAIAWFALFALPGAFVVMLVTRHRGGMGEPRSVPLALLVVAGLVLVATPAQSLVSRRMEAEADWKALETTRDPTAARGLFRELAVTSLADPSPPRWAQLLLGSHPTLADRVAMADAWASRRTP